MIPTLGLFWTILFFVLAISPLVFLHELGHYLAGRWCGVDAKAFSIGFGRPIAKWTDRRGTAWQIGWMPLGGYVRFAGDMNAASQTDPEWLSLPADERNRTFPSKPVWQRALIVLAGPLTNFLVAIVMLVGLFTWIGEPRVAPEIGFVAKQSAAAEAGLTRGDRIIAIEGEPIERFDDIALYVQPRAGKATAFEIQRGGTRTTLTITPRRETFKDLTGAEVSTGRIGIAPLRLDLVRLSPAEIPFAALRFTVSSVKTIATVLKQTISGDRSFSELGGPVKIATTSNAIAKLGLINFLFFVVMISINLGFINLLPIPMLDGGHLVFYAAEAIRGKPVPDAAQEWAYRTGLAALLAFMAVVTVNDLAGLGLWRGIAGLIG